MSMIIGQLRNWLKSAPGGESETAEQQQKFDLIQTDSGKYGTLWLLNHKKRIPRRKTFTSQSKGILIRSDSISILLSATCCFLSDWERTADARFGRKSTNWDENPFPDYTCLACGWEFILGCFNPSWCGTDSQPEPVAGTTHCKYCT